MRTLLPSEAKVCRQQSLPLDLGRRDRWQAQGGGADEIVIKVAG